MRWPVVLEPKSFESLSSWLERHAKYYNVSIDELFTSELNINPINSMLEIDFYKNEKLFSSIESKTGLQENTIYEMTLPSLSPMILDFIDIYTRKDLENYLNSFCIFYWIKQRHIIHNSDTNKNISILPWVRETPWSRRKNSNRFCPVCVEESDGYKILPWRLCVLSTCPKHKCFLVEKNKNQQDNNKNNFFNMKPQNELLLLDDMTLYAFKNGFVSFPNGDRMCGMIWFRFLRGLAKQLCVIKNKSSQYLHLRNELRDRGIDVDYKAQFEMLAQEKRISIMTSISILISNWPINILSKLHLEWWYKYPYSHKGTVPFSLAKHIDISMSDEEIHIYNVEFSILSRRLKETRDNSYLLPQ